MSTCDQREKTGSCSCHTTPVNPSVTQSLDELEFERSIYQAAIDNNVEKIRQLSSRGNFDVDAKDNYGYTALHYASRNGSIEAAKYLLNQGAKIDLQTENLKATALHRAVSGRKLQMVKYLISAGANCQIQDVDGLTPKDRATKDGLQDIIKLFESS